MSNSKPKVLKKKKLSDFEYYVELEYKKKIIKNNFSLPGLRLNLEKIEDKKSAEYIITKAMIDAVDKPKAAKAEEVKIDNGQNNSEG